MYKDLVELYNKGELQRPKDNYLYYHLNEQRKALGNKYVIHDHWDNFVAGIALNKKWDEEILSKILWKK